MRTESAPESPVVHTEVDRSPRGLLPRWLPILLIGLVYVAGASSMVMLDRYEDNSRTSQLMLAQLESTANGISALEGQVREQGRVTPSVMRRIDGHQQQFTDDLASLARISTDRELPERIESLYLTTMTALTEQLRLIQDGRLDEAAQLDEEYVDPAFDELADAIYSAEETLSASVDDANRASTIGRIVLVALSLTLPWWFMRRLEREGRVASQLAAERAALRASDERFRTLARDVADVFLISGPDGAIQYHSPAVLHTWGYGEEAVQGSSVLEMLHPDDRAAARDMLDQVSQVTAAKVKSELRVRHADESWHSCEVIASNLLGDPNIRGIVLTFHDISERKNYEEELTRLAFYDSLSGLPNRALFRERLDNALTRSARWHRSVAVIFLDLDGFKVVNDSLGHEAGDELLVIVGQRLGTCLRAGDTVARLGGDEFTIVLEDIGGIDDAAFVADRILETLQQPITIENREVFISASLGIAMSGPSADHADSLMRNADLAMYRAKTAGKARFEIFDPSMNESALERLELESDLHGALERGEFRILYQPILNLESRLITEVEALLRWDHPRRGLVSPLDFIPICEENGLIVPIGRWVLEQACLQARRWQDENPILPPLIVGVNLSPRQFLEPTLISDVRSALAEANLPPSSLRVEITEGLLMESTSAVVANLNGLKVLGVQIAIDDFGTGYSSLNYLKRLPIDTLKIDRSFVEGLAEAQSTAIVRSMIELAKSLNLVVTGEGIETDDQLQRLRDLGCDLGQGYLFARPTSAADITKLLSAAQRERPSLKPTRTSAA